MDCRRPENLLRVGIFLAVISTACAAILLRNLNPLYQAGCLGVALTAGALKYPLARFLLVVHTGKLLKFVGLAYACAFGADWLVRFFPVGHRGKTPSRTRW